MHLWLETMTSDKMYNAGWTLAQLTTHPPGVNQSIEWDPPKSIANRAKTICCL